MRIVYTSRALKDILALPLKIKNTIERKVSALSEWPQVSGVRALEGMDGYRIHAGDHRVIFTVENGEIVVQEVTDRKDVCRKKRRRARDVDLVSVPRSSLRGHRNYAADLLRWAIAEDLKAARRHADLTQAELARRIRRSQATVSHTEAGRIRVSDAYVSAVLKACDLPDDWKAPRYPSGGGA